MVFVISDLKIKFFIHLTFPENDFNRMNIYTEKKYNLLTSQINM